MQSTSLHVAIIMDGNGRWAARQHRPRSAGHEAGVEAVRRVVSAAPPLGIRTLTLYALSSDNLGRPQDEVARLFDLLREYLERETLQCRREGIRLSVVGRRDRLPLPLRAAVAAAERRTRGGRRLGLRLAVDYSGRDQLIEAARRAGGGQLTRERFAELLGQAGGATGPSPDVDLLIRTGGERRLSDFLLWECAYAELLMLDRPWPEFGSRDLADAVTEYRSRQRRFGLLPSSTVAEQTPPPPSLGVVP